MAARIPWWRVRTLAHSPLLRASDRAEAGAVVVAVLLSLGAIPAAVNAGHTVYRDELQVVLHADGHGTPEDKLATWNALQQDLPGGIFMAWKNFYDEDTPMFTPEETMNMEPQPWLVTFQ